MSGKRTSAGPRRYRAWGLIAAIGLGIGVAGSCLPSASAQTTPPPMPPMQPKEQPKDPPKEAPKDPPKEVPILVEFAMDGKPWSEVLEWLVEKTGKPIISDFKPTGSLTFKAPKGKKYSLPQIIDVINEAMVTQKYILIQREQSFTLVPAGEKIDKTIVPSIKLEELDKHGNTETVRVTIPLKSLLAEDMQSELKPLLGPFGEISVISRPNYLVVQDTVSNIRRVKEMINAIEENEKSGASADTFSYVCKHIKARDAERVVKDLLGDKNKPQEQQQPQYDRFGRPLPPPPPVVTNKRAITVTSDDVKNVVLVNGPADLVARAKKIITDLDEGDKDKPTIEPGPAAIKQYTIQSGSADAIAKTLQEVFKNSTSVKITFAGTTIIAYATPEDHKEIKKQIEAFQQGAKAQLIPVGAMDAPKVADTLKAIFGDLKTGGPHIEAVIDRNAILVRGSDEQVKQVVDTVKVLAGDVTGGGNIRVFTLEKGSAATLAEALEKVLTETRKNPVKIIAPGGGSGGSGGSTPKPMDKAPQDKSSSLDRRQIGELVARADNLKKAPKKIEQVGDVLVKQSGGVLADPQADKRTGTDKPVTITAFGNRLVVTSEDPEALALVAELVRLITSTPGGEGDFEVIRLRVALASEAARVLDEAFNGPRQQQQQGGGQRGGGGGGGILGLIGQFGGAGAAPPADPKPERIRIVADPGTNSLLVRASPLDMLTIRRLLEKAIDAQDSDSEAVVKSWILPVKHAAATEMASLLKDVYKDAVNAAPQTSSVGGFQGFGFPFGGQQQQQRQPQSQTPKMSLAVGVDDKTNTLVLACSEILYKDIKKLVEELDEAAKDSSKTVMVVPIKGIDPYLIQQAVDAVQGRRTTTTRPGTTTAPGTGNFGNFGNFQQGGGQRPGGFTPGGGAFPGGGFQGGGGGGNRGGGGGGTRGGGGRTSSLPPDQRGSDFFEQRVMDDPQSSLFDPQLGFISTETSDVEPLAVPPGTTIPGGAAPLNQTHNIQQIRYNEQQQQPPMPQPMQPGQPMQPAPLQGTSIVGPRSPVTAEALEQLGIIVISGNNPADVQAIIKVIEFLQKEISPTSEVQIELVLLKEGDATSVVTTLNQLLSRVNFGVSGNSVIVGGGQRGGFPQQGQQGFPQQGQQGQQGFPQQGQQGQQGFPQQGQQGAQQAVPANVVLIPLPRFNGILVATAKARMDDVKKEITRLDMANKPDGQVTVFALKKASASRVANLLTNFYNTRYPNEGQNQHQTRFTYDDSINSVFVQAGPADLAEIQQLIFRLDNAQSNAVNELRIVPLQYAQADELAAVLLDAMTDNIVSGTGTGPGATPGGGQTGPGGVITPTTPPGGGLQGRTGSTGANGVKTKSTAIRFRSLRRPGTEAVESGLFEDVQITSDLRTNSLIIAAPPQTMELIFNLIGELDVLPNSRARLNVFTLKKGDANSVGTLLLQLFGGATTTGGGAGGVATGAGSTTTTGLTPRITVDLRTNSVIVAAGLTDLEVIEAIITKLEDSEVEQRKNEIVLLRNATAVDVANALTQFIQTSLSQVGIGPQQAGVTEYERQVVVIPEPITNKLLISASPRYFGEVMRLIAELDTETPMVVIQVLIAEIDLTGLEEFGVEIGLQAPVFFQRGLAALNSTVNNATVPAIGSPGFPFNNPAAGIPNSALAGPEIVGFQGLSNLGTGRVGSSGQSGFVFTAASDTFNLLIRALKTQGRADILSRPQVTTLDNQYARVFVGQSVPILTGTTITVGVAQPNIQYADVGIDLQVTPKINPDGRVVMRVTPSISSVNPQTVNLGNGFFAPQFNLQQVDTTVAAFDGETVAVGGLISKRDGKTENKIPWLGDLPYVGAAFRFRSQQKSKQELLVILTPHIVRNRMEADAILAYESRRMDWLIGDVLKTQGPSGLEPILPPPSSDPRSNGACNPAAGNPGELPTPLIPPQPQTLPQPSLPQPQPQPVPSSSKAAPQPLPVGPSGTSQTGGPSLETTAPLVQTSAPPMAPATSQPLPPLRPVPKSNPRR